MNCLEDYHSKGGNISQDGVVVCLNILCGRSNQGHGHEIPVIFYVKCALSLTIYVGFLILLTS